MHQTCNTHKSKIIKWLKKKTEKYRDNWVQSPDSDTLKVPYIARKYRVPISGQRAGWK